MFLRRIILFAALLYLLTEFVLPRAVGMVLEPRLEKKLTRLFDMPVKIEGLHGQLLNGHVWARGITFWNQPGFSNRPHLDVQGIEFDIDYLALRDKRVIIRNAVLNHPFYLLERISTPQGIKNNIVMWWDHIESQTGEDIGAPEAPDEKRWFVSIDKIVFHDGTFIFHDRTREGMEKKLVFQKFEAIYDGFSWRTLSPVLLSQGIFIAGLFGEKAPAPFRIYGRANFATSEVSFKLDGVIKGGALEEQKNLWEGLPIQVKAGTFDLNIRAVCIRKHLKSKSLLTMKSVQVAAGPSATDKIWGLPMSASMIFLQNQKTLHLKIPVHGDITDPKFEFFHAYRVAFQESLRKKIESGIHFLARGTAKIAAQTREVLVETPAKLATEGIGRIATIVKSKAEIFSEPDGAVAASKPPAKS